MPAPPLSASHRTRCCACTPSANRPAPQNRRLQRRFWPSLAVPYGALSDVPLTRQSDRLLTAMQFAGQFKRVDNDIVELRPAQAPRRIVRFRCVTAAETPAAVAELCERYRYALREDNIPPLIAIAALVLDFLGIHPFRDGNDYPVRVSRLLTTAAGAQPARLRGRPLPQPRTFDRGVSGRLLRVSLPQFATVARPQARTDPVVQLPVRDHSPRLRRTGKAGGAGQGPARRQVCAGAVRRIRGSSVRSRRIPPERPGTRLSRRWT